MPGLLLSHQRATSSHANESSPVPSSARALLGACLLATCTLAAAEGGPHWNYSGHEGPEHWADLDASWTACRGVNQSPVDLRDFVDAELPPISFDYVSATETIVHNGHTVQMSFAPGSSIQVDGQRFELVQVHFHAPSENRIEGKSFPLEAHLVHAAAGGELAVVALMYSEGSDNPELASAWEEIPAAAGDPQPMRQKIDSGRLLPGARDYYRFNGSLTTPPCTEGVRWLVMREPQPISPSQIGRIEAALGHHNNRPTQPLGARLILR